MQWFIRKTRALAFAIGLLVALGLAVRFSSRRLVFPAWRVGDAAPARSLTMHTLRANDGSRVIAFERVRGAGRSVVVLFHGNRERAENGAWLADELAARGFDVVLPEYRGYGRSTVGEPSERALYDDAEVVLADLARRGFGPDRVILWGTSLGTGVAAAMAQRGHARALVLVTPYTSIPDVVADAVPVLPVRWMVRDEFDTRARASTIRVPTLVVHGDVDEVVPYWMGATLAAEIPHARLIPIAGGHHGDLFARAGAHLIDQIAAFAKRV